MPNHTNKWPDAWNRSAPHHHPRASIEAGGAGNGIPPLASGLGYNAHVSETSYQGIVPLLVTTETHVRMLHPRQNSPTQTVHYYWSRHFELTALLALWFLGV